ncbi:MAG: hypothetical protein SW019_13920 [Actinomycetota bacterium]|nr:hypothetical protein [Actinomycetota bacterium]
MCAAAPGRAIPDTGCALTTHVQEVAGLTELPPALRSALPPMAERGASFNAGDAVTDADLPSRRLIRAGHLGDRWFVWYEHGGEGYFWHVVVARVGDDTGDDEPTVTMLADAGTISDTLCTVTDGALADRVPPYPPGAWAASGY